MGDWRDGVPNQSPFSPSSSSPPISLGSLVNYPNQHLSLANRGLTSLRDLPILPHLTSVPLSFVSPFSSSQLDLSDNKLHEGLEMLRPLTALRVLNLSGNGFNSMLHLFHLVPSFIPSFPHSLILTYLFLSFPSLISQEHLPALRELDLEGCGVTKVPDFNRLMFELMPHLSRLNSLTKVPLFALSLLSLLPPYCIF